jgi:hypothetical protein
MDKYLRLVRRVTSHALRYCADRDWKLEIVADIASVFEKAALVAGTRGMVDVGLRLHISELFLGELRGVAAGTDLSEVGCDPSEANEGNGGAPRTVFKKIASNVSVSSRGKDDGAKNGKRARGALGRKKHPPTLVPSECTELFLDAFATVLRFDSHKQLHRRVLEQVFEAAVEGADGGVAQRALLGEHFEHDADEEEGIDPKDRKEALAAATMVRLDAATMKRMSRKFIELGAVDGVDDLNRESLYYAHALFMKAAKRAAKAAEAGEEDSVSAKKNDSSSKKRRKKEDPSSESDEAAMEEEEDSEEDLEESFHTAVDADEENDDSDEENDDDSDDVEAEDDDDDEAEEDDDDEAEEDDDDDVEAKEDDDVEAEEADADIEGTSDEEDDVIEKEEPARVSEDPDDSLESLDDSDLDNSEEDSGEESSDASGDDADSDEELARHEALVAAGIAAAERKALRKAERWAAAVGATPPPRASPSSAKKISGAGSSSSLNLAKRALGVGVPSSPGSPGPSSPSKRVLWNLKRNTRHTPTGPPNPVRGDGLRALLNTTPRKSLLRPIHAAVSMGLPAPGSDPGARRKDKGLHEKASGPQTMTPGRKKMKTSMFFG